MRETLRLGRIAGIPVGINWSVLVVMGLIAVGLGLGGFPQSFPGYDDSVYLLAGLVTAVLFLGSILAHELGHALLARRKGIPVEGIVLWLLGGVAKFSSEARSPRDEIQVALVGPVVSAALGVLFGLLASAVAVASGAIDTLGVGLLGWLALINIVLAVFNLIPAAPLDGGRVLRGVLWARKGDPAAAAEAAARGGKRFGIVLIGAGLLLIAFMASFDGLWLMLLGWFIVTAANAEEFHARLKGVRVRDVMTPDPVVAPDWISVQDLIDQYVLTRRCSTFPLRAFDGRITGLVPLSAVKRTPGDQRDSLRVRDVAVPIEQVPVGSPAEDLSDLLARVGGGATDGRALVFELGELVGIVSPRDVARAEQLRALRVPPAVDGQDRQTTSG